MKSISRVKKSSVTTNHQDKFPTEEGEENHPSLSFLSTVDISISLNKNSAEISHRSPQTSMDRYSTNFEGKILAHLPLHQ